MMLAIVILSFPVVFMFHEFEELIGLSPWLARNKNSLTRRFPTLRKPIQKLSMLSAPAFAVAVFEEFLVVGVVTLWAFFTGGYYAWVAMFLAFSFHLLVHIAQWLVVRRYIPMIVTSVLCLPYCVYVLMQIAPLFSGQELLFCFLFGVLFMAINLLLAHRLGVAYDRWMKRYEK